MSKKLHIPKLGFAMTEAMLTEWFAADGSAVSEGQPIYAIESEKSVQEIEAPASGTLRITAQAGEIYPVGTYVGEIE
jgi:pyruvate/2-oxoglutarate dehydrogenase complex dihydrolipoamide acyltransferase (E2) component